MMQMQQNGVPNAQGPPPMAPEAPYLGAAATAAYSQKDSAFASNDYFTAQQIVL